MTTSTVTVPELGRTVHVDTEAEARPAATTAIIGETELDSFRLWQRVTLTTRK